MSTDHSPYDRRRFLRTAAGGLVAAMAAPRLAGCEHRDPIGIGDPAGPPLPTPPVVGPAGLQLMAAPSAGGSHEGAWLYNGVLPGPTIEAWRGEVATIRFHNQLGEPSIVHWHGLIVTEANDGHPKYAVDPGAMYDYAFSVDQRAATSWYHPHAHHLTGGQVQRGLAGLFIIRDEEETRLDLPSGDREVLLVLQDRNPAAAFGYSPSAHDWHAGLIGSAAFLNGVREPVLDVAAEPYRVRVLNGSQARIYRLGLSNAAPLTVIGNDGGLLPAAVAVNSIYLGVGERVDLLLDLSSMKPGERVVLKSLPFSMTGSAAAHGQGTDLDLLMLHVTRPRSSRTWALPHSLTHVPRWSAAEAAATQSFTFTSGAGHAHRINGQSFVMDRVDAEIPLGELQLWTFDNQSELPHPVHLHGTHFQILARHGGRNRVYAYEEGWKDTVLLMPLERVDVLVRFDAYRGIYPLHCHNLQHEDMGMMLNVAVV